MLQLCRAAPALAILPTSRTRLLRAPHLRSRRGLSRVLDLQRAPLKGLAVELHCGSSRGEVAEVNEASSLIVLRLEQAYAANVATSVEECCEGT